MTKPMKGKGWNQGNKNSVFNVRFICVYIQLVCKDLPCSSGYIKFSTWNIKHLTQSYLIWGS